MARCGFEDCGAALTVKPAGHGQAPRYVCDQSRPGRPGCGRIAIAAPALDELVAEMVLARDWRHLDTRAARAVGETDLAAELAAAEQRLIEVGRLHARGRIGTEEWLTQRDELADQVNDLRAQRDTLRREAADAALPKGGEELRAWWDDPDTTLEQQRAAVERVLVCVLVKPATRRGIRTLDPDRVEPIWR